MEEKIASMKQLLECTCGMELSHIPRSKEHLYQHIARTIDPAFDVFLQNDSYWQQILDMPQRSDTIYEFSASGGIYFFTYMDKSNDSIFFFGPILTQPFSRDSVMEYFMKYDLPVYMENHILQFFDSIPVISAERVYRIIDTSLRQLLALPYPLKFVDANSVYTLENMISTSLPTITPEIAQMRQVEIRYEYGTALIEAIKHGNISLANHIVGQYIPGSDNPIRNQNPLRNAQNYCIVINTQLRHAMEECGIHPYRVDKLSSEIGLQIEQLTEVSKLKDFFDGVIRQYCRLVQTHAYPNLNPLTNLTVEYIKEHLSENITVKETAKALTVNANYLSTQFHANMGISFIEFLNKERVHQAAALLGKTNLQIQQISQFVGYNNTSYFTKQFCRHMGVTPRQYRSQQMMHP